MTELTALRELVILFGAAVAVSGLSQRFHLPSSAGFLLTGIVVGPSALGWIEHSHRLETFAELGVVLLLFGIGLELSVERLRRLGWILLVGGSLQVGLTALAVAGVVLGLGHDVRLATLLGFIVALSSTAIVLKRYAERRELDTPSGRAATGVLLFQDLLIAPLLLLVPVLAGGGALSPLQLVLRIGGGLLVVAVLFAAGRLLLPSLLRLLAESRGRELLLLGALFVCLGAGLVTEALGFSLALGAFLAGVLISGSDVQHQVLAETGPLRDIFNSLFFVSVGMLVDLELVAGELETVIGLVVAVMVAKALVVWAVLLALRYPSRARIGPAFALSQVGELSFVLALSAYQHGLLADRIYELVIAVAVLTMLVTPAAIALAGRVAARTARDVTDRLEATESTPVEHLSDHVVIAGFGLNGRHLARVLESACVPYVAVDLDPRRVHRAEGRGEPIVLGDIARTEIQRHCGIESARACVFALSDPVALPQGISVARRLNPELFIVARTRRLDEIPHLLDAGADRVVAEEFETSIEIVTALLKRLHVPGNVIRSEARLLRAEGYEMLRSPERRGLSDELAQALAMEASDSFLLGPEHAAVGQTLAELGLRSRTGAMAISVIRSDQPIVNPSPEVSLESGDIVVLVGGHLEIEAAFRLLSEMRES